MLVLTRKLMEKLYIGDEICVTVVRLEGGQVRLGIEAPREISVVRAELLPTRRIPPAAAAEGDGVVDGSRPPLRIRPASAPGNGSRRRGPSR